MVYVHIIWFIPAKFSRAKLFSATYSENCLRLIIFFFLFNLGTFIARKVLAAKETKISSQSGEPFFQTFILIGTWAFDPRPGQFARRLGARVSLNSCSQLERKRVHRVFENVLSVFFVGEGFCCNLAG